MKEEEQSNQTQPSHCGSKPKRIAVGIAPLGTISIGIVPMGVICIGIVPMGVVSLGVVAMGVINISAVGMGIVSLGITSMGIWTAGPVNMGLFNLLGDLTGDSKHQHHSHGGDNKQLDKVDDRFIVYPSAKEAEQKAKELGCKGAHKMGNHWMPCKEHSNH